MALLEISVISIRPSPPLLLLYITTNQIYVINKERLCEHYAKDINDNNGLLEEILSFESPLLFLAFLFFECPELL